MTALDVKPTGSRRAERWGAAAGIAFVVFFVLRFVFLNTPDSDAPVREWTEHFQDSGDRTLSILGGYSMALAGLAFLCFVWAVRGRLRRSEVDPHGLSTLAYGSGLVFVAMLFASGAAMTTVAASVEFGDNPVPDGEFARQFENLGFGLLLLYAMFAVAVCIAATSGSALRTGVLPRWLVIAGFVVAVLVGVFGVIFLPMILLVLWVLAVSIVMLLRPGTSLTDGERVPLVS
jgi:hypothetical protein